MPKLQAADYKYDASEISPEKLISSISFSHFIELMKIDDPVKRMYYEMLTIHTGLSVRELKRQIGALSYERVGLSGNMENALKRIESSIHPQNVANAIKDDYFFEFLNIPQQRAALLKENDLETLLLNHLQDFILVPRHVALTGSPLSRLPLFCKDVAKMLFFLQPLLVC